MWTRAGCQDGCGTASAVTELRQLLSAALANGGGRSSGCSGSDFGGAEGSSRANCGVASQSAGNGRSGETESNPGELAELQAQGSSEAAVQTGREEGSTQGDTWVLQAGYKKGASLITLDELGKGVSPAPPGSFMSWRAIPREACFCMLRFPTRGMLAACMRRWRSKF